MGSNKQKKKIDSLDVVFGVACLLVIAVLITYWFNFKNNPISSEVGSWGAFGDYVGGTINPILGFFSFMALLITLDLQRKQLNKTEEQLELNREELKLTRKELEKAADAQIDTARVMREQLKTQALHQFENSFYNLNKSLDTAQTILLIHDLDKLNSVLLKSNLKEARMVILSNTNLSRYMMILYQLLKMIDGKINNIPNLSINEKYSLKKFYSNLIRSQQDNKLLKLLFINCFEEFDDYRELLRKFEFFEHMSFEHNQKLSYLLLVALNFYTFEGKITLDKDKEFFGRSHYLKALSNYGRFLNLFRGFSLKYLMELQFEDFLKLSLQEAIRFENRKKALDGDLYLNILEIEDSETIKIQFSGDEDLKNLLNVFNFKDSEWRFKYTCSDISCGNILMVLYEDADKGSQLSLEFQFEMKWIVCTFQTEDGEKKYTFRFD